ncbi:hypothetical protein EVAR_90952_1 [Eumeta japonica]|uniref:Uncharacterized protein n=1 Tax=Eumeta variegata TaxID=151549 RepID=A0A4C1ZB43_EUMVA|nr:hypothetical protein EVAR_90952_1 [Eumeta japonica]
MSFDRVFHYFQEVSSFNRDVDCRVEGCTLLQKNMTTLNSVQYILFLSGVAGAILRVLQVKPIQIVCEPVMSLEGFAPFVISICRRTLCTCSSRGKRHLRSFNA